MIKLPRFSVLIPLYNKASSIRSTIESVLNQTFKDFELIIINDGSTDDSIRIAGSIVDTRIRIISQKNEGVSSARNSGIMAAISDYLAFLDADDFWEANYLEIMNSLIEEFCEAHLFSCQFKAFYKNDLCVWNQIHTNRGYIADFFISSCKAHVISSSSIIVRKECFNEVGYFNTALTRGEDVEMWVRLIRRYQLAFEPTPLVIYRMDEENRACNFTPPLRNFYLEFNLLGKPKSERRYFLKFAELTLLELIRKKRIFPSSLLLLKYNIFGPVILIKLFRNHVHI